MSTLVDGQRPTMFGGGAAAQGDDYVRCNRCGYGGCDVRVAGCGCTLHARCTMLPSQQALTHCPSCSRPTTGLVLFPMSFRDIDDARRTSSAFSVAPRGSGRGRKRKGLPDFNAIDEAAASYVSERRTGRWTTEEMTYCDKIIAKFETGELPIASGTKLNDFLGNMLKSKQSRLTKKMKNAKLSSKTFQLKAGAIIDTNEARDFSALEESFFQAVQCQQERAEIKFHMQREWREQFSQFCVSVGQQLDADAWLSSVEELDRRASQAKDAARMAKRKLMMGFALRTDSQNPDQGVFIEKTEAEQRVADVAETLEGSDDSDTTEMLQLLTEESKWQAHAHIYGKSTLLHSAPFLAKVIAYIQRHNIPFEHVDVWVPSFVVPNDSLAGNCSGPPPNCRLCFAGSATVDEQVDEDGKTRKPLSAEDQFNLFAFGDYSQKFSFDVGCGLPGRVYEHGRPTWEQSVQNAPHHHFERCGGALQWGIKTVVGVPIASPNVGRVVVILYSCHDREKDQDLVARLSEELTRLLPSPKWMLVVDVGEPDSADPANVISEPAAVPGIEPSDEISGDKDTNGRDSRIDEVVILLGEMMPSDPASPLAPYLSGLMSLRLLLLRPSRSPEDDELVRIMLDSYSSYSQGGRSRADIGVMLARDYMFLSQQRSQQQPQPQPTVSATLQLHQHQPAAQVQQQHLAQNQHIPHASSQQQQQQLFHSLSQQQLFHQQQQQQPQQDQQNYPSANFFSLGQGMANSSQVPALPAIFDFQPRENISLGLAPIPPPPPGSDGMSVVSN